MKYKAINFVTFLFKTLKQCPDFKNFISDLKEETGP